MLVSSSPLLLTLLACDAGDGGDSTMSSEEYADLLAQLASLTASLSEAQGDISDLSSAFSDAQATIADLESQLDGNATQEWVIKQGYVTETGSGVDYLDSYVTVDPATSSIVFSGANVYVQDGSGDTDGDVNGLGNLCLLYTSPSPRDLAVSRMPSSA